MSAVDRQQDHRDIWNRKPVLREIYGDIYQRIASERVTGLTIEVGGGSGWMAEFQPEALRFDVVYQPWLNFVADAQDLPIADASVSNLVMVDVLHHIDRPARFLREAARVLRPGGRLICVEPGLTPVSTLFYRFFHEERLDTTEDVLLTENSPYSKEPYDGNQAIPTLLFERRQAAVAAMLPELELKRLQKFSLLAYPLSGGYKPWSLINAPLAQLLLKLENRVEATLGGIFAFRLLAVLEKKAKAGL
jgi:SAM-dependent methyltransferase